MNNVNQIDEHQEGDFSVSTDPKKLDLAFTHHWLSNEAYWSEGLPFNVFKRMIDNSLCFGVYHQCWKTGGVWACDHRLHHFCLADRCVHN